MENQIDGFLYLRAEKGTYGLSQGKIISKRTLKEDLIPFGYADAPITLGIWRHKTNVITLKLVVENFEIKI